MAQNWTRGYQLHTNVRTLRHRETYLATVGAVCALPQPYVDARAVEHVRTPWHDAHTLADAEAREAYGTAVEVESCRSTTATDIERFKCGSAQVKQLNKGQSGTPEKIVLLYSIYRRSLRLDSLDRKMRVSFAAELVQRACVCKQIMLLRCQGARVGQYGRTRHTSVSVLSRPSRKSNQASKERQGARRGMARPSSAHRSALSPASCRVPLFSASRERGAADSSVAGRTRSGSCRISAGAMPGRARLR